MIRYITYKGEKLPISISFYALEQLEIEDVSLEDGNLKSIRRLFWHSLNAGAFHEGTKINFDEKDTAFVLDGCFQEFQELMPLFLEELTKEKKPGSAKEAKGKN